MFCTGCGASISGEDRFCATRSDPLGAARRGARRRPQVVDRRAQAGIADLMAGGATLLLLIVLFLPWYSVQTEASPPISASALADPAGGFRVLLLVGCLVVLGYLAARTVMRPGARLPLPHWQLLTVLTSIDGLLALLALFVRPSGPDFGLDTSVSVESGAVLGVLFAAVATLGAVFRRRQPELVDTRSWTSFSHRPVPAGRFAVPFSAPAAAEPARATDPARAADPARATDQSRATDPANRCPACASPAVPGNRFCIDCGALIVP